MTYNEAVERAKKIWGKQVKRAYDFGDCWGIDLRGDDRGHTLDQNGYVICHDDCKRLEEKVP